MIKLTILGDITMTDPNMQSDVVKIKPIKRISAYLIDFILIITAFATLFNLGGSKILTNLASDNISSINNIFVTVAADKDVPTTTGNYEFLIVDSEKYMTKYQNENPGSDRVKAYEAFITINNEVLTLVKSHEDYNTNYQSFIALKRSTELSSLLIVSLVFLIIVPYFNKYQATLGMLILKLAVVNLANNKVINKWKIIPRFLVFSLIEFYLLYFFFGYLFIAVTILLTILLIFINKNRFTITDIVSQSKVIDQKYINLVE